MQIFKMLPESARYLLAPISYIKIKHSFKTQIDLLALIAGIGIASVFTLITNINYFGEFGLVHGGNGLLQILVGFFITSLIGVATFPGSAAYPMDDPMRGEIATLRHSIDDIEELTRRRFLCILFGYLALTSLILYTAGATSMMIGPRLKVLLGSDPEFYITIMRITFSFFYIPLFCHVFATTLVGLVFLSDRIPSGVGRPTAVFTRSRGNES